jgi:hypothetical protein
MRVSQPVRPIARLATELRITGAGQLAVGLAGLVVSLLTTDVGPGRIVVPFAVAFLLVGALSMRASRWMREADTPAAAPDVRVESAGLTLRRCLVALIVPVIPVAAAVAIGGGLGAVLGGIVAAVGAIDLRSLGWVRGRERELGRGLYRELGPSPFSSGRRPLYTRPLNESTLAT